MSDPRTLAVYARAAETYAERVGRRKDIDQSADLARFIAALPPGGRVLDLGCGPGQWAAALRDAGLAVEASDASPEMAALALAEYGIEVRVETFEALDGVLADRARYDGIWANFSLLHAPRAAFPGHLARIRRALKPGGMLHLGMKLPRETGADEGRDDLDRFFSYWSAEELTALLGAAGFTPVHQRTGSGTGLSGVPDSYVVILAHG